MRSHQLSLCIPIPLLPWISCHRVLRTTNSSQVYLYMHRDCGPSKPAQTAYVLLFTCVDVIGVVTMLSNVSSMQSRTRQNEVLKRTVTICNARSVAHRCYSLTLLWILVYYVCMGSTVYGCLSYEPWMTAVLHWMLYFGVSGQLHSQLNRSIEIERPPRRP